jgi:hypothetical protein
LKDTNKILYLIRGIPGSGKSSLAKSLGGKHVEADMYHLDENGNYNWKPVDVKKAHEWCQSIMGGLCPMKPVSCQSLIPLGSRRGSSSQIFLSWT